MNAIVTLSPRSNFLESPGVTAYHSYFFHGLSGREGKWFPHDPATIDAETISVAPLHIQLNRFRMISFTWPGGWPVISSHLANRLQGINGIQLQQVTFNRVINCEWNLNSPIQIAFANLSAFELFARFPSVDHSDLLPRFELRTLMHRNVASDIRAGSALAIELGTSPMSKQHILHYSFALMERYPILRFSGSLIIDRKVFDVIEDEVNPKFFNIREYELKQL